MPQTTCCMLGYHERSSVGGLTFCIFSSQWEMAVAFVYAKESSFCIHDEHLLCSPQDRRLHRSLYLLNGLFKQYCGGNRADWHWVQSTSTEAKVTENHMKYNLLFVSSERWDRCMKKETIRQTVTKDLNNHALCVPPHSECRYDSSQLCVYIFMNKQIWIMQNQSQIDVNRTNGAAEMNLLELIESGTVWGTWVSHITRTLTVWPCLMQWCIMIDIPAAVTLEPQYLIKFQPNIRCSQMNRAPEEFAFLLVTKDGRKNGW